MAKDGNWSHKFGWGVLAQNQGACNASYKQAFLQPQNRLLGKGAKCIDKCVAVVQQFLPFIRREGSIDLSFQDIVSSLFLYPLIIFPPGNLESCAECSILAVEYGTGVRKSSRWGDTCDCEHERQRTALIAIILITEMCWYWYHQV